MPIWRRSAQNGEAFLHKFLKLPNGIPDSDTFRRLFEKLNTIALSECLVKWLTVKLPERCVIAVDDRIIRSSGNKKHKAYHVVSAFVARSQITLGEITVDGKSNEITAVPELLDLLYINCVYYCRFHELSEENSGKDHECESGLLHCSER